MDEKTEALHEKYFATLEAATRLFAEAKPPADPPEFPLRSEDTNEAMQALERHNAYFLTDLTRWDRPPISLIFQVERSPIPLDPDPIVEKIVRFTELRRLGVHNLQLEDRHLEQLSDLKELGELWLGSDRITAEGMAHVARLPRLERLYLYGTKADAQTLEPLAAAKLKEFGASEKDFDDESAALAKNWSDLEALYLGNTSLSDTGLSHVPGLPRLKVLELADTKITDASAPLLGKMQNLETLNLEGTALTDAAIPELKKLKKLKALDVSGTQITQEGAESLKEALPGCEVSGN
jgi:hypothetical protein